MLLSSRSCLIISLIHTETQKPAYVHHCVTDIQIYAALRSKCGLIVKVKLSPNVTNKLILLIIYTSFHILWMIENSLS